MILIAMTTIDKKQRAISLAQVLLNQKAVACVNIIPGATSVYRWKGKICRDTENILIMKTTRGKFSKLKKLIKEHHPYELPELLAWSPREGSAEFIKWAEKECQ